ncbi:MAG: hypothetical protein P8R42_28465 [Candidatus Binatia bacterium]|nr:hypothetical protein [Candidatus Binatia bacterium]
MRKVALHALLIGLLLIGASTSPAHAETVGIKLRFGITDTEPTNWTGRLTVKPGITTGVRGWRFDKKDQTLGTNGWRAATRHMGGKRRTNKPEKERTVEGPPLDNGVIVTLHDVTPDSRISVTTKQGDFEFLLRDLPFGTYRTELEGAVEVERTASAQQLTSALSEDDFPAAAIDARGRTNLAWVRFTPYRPGKARVFELQTAPADFAVFAEPPLGDQVILETYTATGDPTYVTITEPGRDVYRCATAIDGSGRIWVVWSEKQGPFFEVWARPVKDGVAAAPIRLSTGAGNAHSAVATTDANGRVWVAWQAVHDGVFRVRTRHQTPDGSFSDEEDVSTHAGSSWAPAISATPTGAKGTARVAIVWDTYEKGDYDVWLREYEIDGKTRDAEAAANSPRYQARASSTYDREGNLWIAWEDGSATWGKDAGALVKGKGSGLLENRKIGLIIRTLDGRWVEPSGALASVMPTNRAIVIPKRGSGEPLSEAARAALPYLNKPYHNLSRLALDSTGRVWLLFRSRAIDFRPTVGSMWFEYAAFYENGSWTGPILIPDSGNLLYSLPAVVAPPGGGLRLVYASDHRQERKARRVTYQGDLDATHGLSNPWVNDLFMARLDVPKPPEAPTFKPAAIQPSAAPKPSDATKSERAAAQKARDATATVRGSEWKLLRGEFHRHTELSSDGGSDGPLEDMWRYAIDVAALDWVGNGDHDNGHNREYPWWLIQKTTDAYYIPGRLTTMYSYERSRPYPEGHRNVIFGRRGIRPLPRLKLAKEDATGPAADTTMLYRYLRQFGGISAPHTTGTRMGTDWRNHDSEVEPIVEIYQGSRNSYEMPGAPRTATGRLAKAERKKGFVSVALEKGHRLGFISSSDHHSTHISYAMLWVDEPSREAILAALKARRVYAATDDIIADVRIGSGDEEHFMGEEFTSAKPAKLRIRLDGTGPFAKVVVVKDGKEVHTYTPGDDPSVRHEWTDPEVTPGTTSHYYVRGEQEDGELVWTSPIWVVYEGET